MALIVEIGGASATAESYCSVADAITFHTNFGNADWLALTTAQQEVLLRKATRFMVSRYRKSWKGYRKTATQALDWPRSFVYLEPFVHGAIGAFPYLVSDTIVPSEVVTACAELALKANTAVLMPDTTQQVKREKVGALEVEYSEFSQQAAQFTSIDAILLPYTTAMGVSVNLSK